MAKIAGDQELRERVLARYKVRYDRRGDYKLLAEYWLGLIVRRRLVQLVQDPHGLDYLHVRVDRTGETAIVDRSKLEDLYGDVGMYRQREAVQWWAGNRIPRTYS